MYNNIYVYCVCTHTHTHTHTPENACLLSHFVPEFEVQLRLHFNDLCA